MTTTTTTSEVKGQPIGSQHKSIFVYTVNEEYRYKNDVLYAFLNGTEEHRIYHMEGLCNYMHEKYGKIESVRKFNGEQLDFFKEISKKGYPHRYIQCITFLYAIHNEPPIYDWFVQNKLNDTNLFIRWKETTLYDLMVSFFGCSFTVDVRIPDIVDRLSSQYAIQCGVPEPSVQDYKDAYDNLNLKSNKKLSSSGVIKQKGLVLSNSDLLSQMKQEEDDFHESLFQSIFNKNE